MTVCAPSASDGTVFDTASIPALKAWMTHRTRMCAKVTYGLGFCTEAPRSMWEGFADEIGEAVFVGVAAGAKGLGIGFAAAVAAGLAGGADVTAGAWGVWRGRCDAAGGFANEVWLAV